MLTPVSPQVNQQFFFVVGSGHGKLPKPAHHEALEKSLGIKDQSRPVLRFVPKCDAVADVTRGEDKPTVSLTQSQSTIQ